MKLHNTYTELLKNQSFENASCNSSYSTRSRSQPVAAIFFPLNLILGGLLGLLGWSCCPRSIFGVPPPSLNSLGHKKVNVLTLRKERRKGACWYASALLHRSRCLLGRGNTHFIDHTVRHIFLLLFIIFYHFHFQKNDLWLLPIKDQMFYGFFTTTSAEMAQAITTTKTIRPWNRSINFILKKSTKFFIPSKLIYLAYQKKPVACEIRGLSFVVNGLSCLQCLKKS